MELKEFIKEVISEISESVIELNDSHKQNGLRVNPHLYNNSSLDCDCLGNGDRVIQVEFHISVTTKNESSKSGGVKLQVVEFGMNKDKGELNLNTVKFSLPVAFPVNWRSEL